MGKTKGSVLLVRQGLGQEEMATVVGCSRQLVSLWAIGRRTPSLPFRQVMLRVWRIPIESWDQPYSGEEAVAEKVGAPVRHGPQGLNVGSVVGQAAKLSGQVQALVDGLEDTATPLERAKVMASAAATLTLLGRITGETSTVAEQRILRLPAWSRIRATIQDTLKGHPQLMEKVGLALIELGEEQLG